MKVILETVFGSMLYGTDTPTSDLDIKGIYIPGSKDILFQRVRDTISVKTKVDDSLKNSAGDTDRETFALHKYFKLLGIGETVAIELLFAPDRWIITNSYWWNEIRDNRHRLISKQINGFTAYCFKQAKKYGIKGSRVAVIRHVNNFLNEIGRNYDPTKVKLGHFAETIERFEMTLNNDFINLVDVPQASGNTVRFLEVCDRKLQYTASLAHALSTCERLLTEYGQRALMAESNQGIDWKALHHAVRVGEQAIELLETGYLTFPRPNADYLKKIKAGELPYKTVAARIEELCDEIPGVSARSALTRDIDNEWVDEFINDVYTEAVIEKRQSR